MVAPNPGLPHWNLRAMFRSGCLDTTGANDDIKGRYAFVYGELPRVHRMGLIACPFRGP